MAACRRPPAVLRRATVRAALLGVVVLPAMGRAGLGPTAVQPLVQPRPLSGGNGPARGAARLAPAPPDAGTGPLPAAAPPSPAPPSPARPGSGPSVPEAFGRWQPRLASCAITLAGRAGDCGAVLVDQRSAGVLRVSWPGRGEGGLASVVTFVGTLAGPSEAMACRQAICSFRQPIELTLSTVSQSLFDGRGVASALPSAWPVNGSCRLEARRIRCEARAFSGETWTADAGVR